MSSNNGNNNNGRIGQAIPKFLRGNFSPAFIYPVKGIWYFATHRFLHPLLRGRLLPLTLLSVAILAVLFFTLYVPVVMFLALFHFKGSAWTNGTFFLLETGNLLIALLFEALFVDHTQVDIFDAVLVAEGYEHLVKNRRPVMDEAGEINPARRLGAREKGAVYAPFSLRQIIEFVILLPLNFVPFAGVPLFLLLTGYRAGPFLNWRYFALRGLTKKERTQFIKAKKRRFEYMWFGTVHMILQLIPALSMLFLLTSAAGSALWAVHLEKEIQRSNATPEEELPPAYTDED